MFSHSGGEYIGSFVWGVVVVVSWLGYGTVIGRRLPLAGSHPLDWGLRCGWGIAFTVVFGGWLCLFQLATAPVLFGFTLLGALVFGAELRWKRHSLIPSLRPERKLPRPWWQWLLLGILCAPLILLYVVNVNALDTEFNGVDDLPAYLPLVRRILQTGTILDGFSWRRLAAYGGHSYLQASTSLVGGALNGFSLERGICPWVIVGLVWGILKPITRLEWIVAVAIALAAALYPVSLTNSQSARTGVVLFLTLLRTLTLELAPSAGSTTRAWVFGMVAAAAASLRAPYVPVVAMTLAFSYTARLVIERHRSGEVVREMFASGIIFLIGIAPWAFLLYRSSNTFLFPIFPGNFNTSYGSLGMKVSLVQTLKWILKAWVSPRVLIFCVPVVLVLRRKYVASLLMFYVATLLVVALLAKSFAGYDIRGIVRYAAAMLFAAAIASLCMAIADRPRFILGVPARAAQIFILVLIPVIAVGFLWMFSYRLKGDLSQMRFRPVSTGPLGGKAVAHSYVNAQAVIPSGAMFVSVVQRPYFFDFRRNPIGVIDDPSGVCSPPPGMPWKTGNDALGAYFKSMNIRYLVLADFTNGELWWSRAELLQATTDTRLILAEHRTAGLRWEFVNRLEDFVAGQKQIYTDGELRVFQLK